MTHPWRFFRAGGADQARIDTADDLLHLRDLDQKRWVALACPTRGLEFDERTLDLIDLDRDGRIRAPELIAACEWVGARLKDWQPLLRGESRLAAASLSDTEEGRALAEELQRTLALAGQAAPAERSDIGLDEIRERQSHLVAERHNGDGIVPVAAFEDASDRALAQAIADALGAVADAGGEPGIDETRIQAFFDQAAAVQAWHAEGEADCAGRRAAAMAVQAVHDKVEDFFARCRLASYDASVAATLNATEPEQLKQHAAGLLSLESGPLKQLPAAPVAAGAALPLDARANPAWRAALAALREQAVRPLLGRDADELVEADWRALKEQVQACREWLKRQPTGPVAALGVEALSALAGAQPEAARARLLAQVVEDRAAAPRHAALNDLEKLLLLQRDLLRLARNFVSFEDFYEGRGAVFQAGTLFIDGRACELAVEVVDPARHAPIAGLAKAYLAYCECVRLNQKRTIVAVVSAGDVDFLFVGRNGLFYDREGHDWDARIVKVIENPISVGQAFLSPYKKLVRLVEEQVAKRAAASDSTQQGRLGQWAGRIATVDQPAAAPATTGAAGVPPAGLPAGLPVPGRRVDVGTVAAIGVALGSISTVIVGIFGRFVDLGWWIPLAVLGIVLSISGPSMLIAWLKLRQRSLGPILDASGWAINNRMKLSTRLGGSLTKRPQPVPHAVKLQEMRRTARDEGAPAGAPAAAVSEPSL